MRMVIHANMKNPQVAATVRNLERMMNKIGLAHRRARKDAYMKCYRCNQPVTTKDDIMFVAANPVHRGKCPKKKRG